MSQNKFVKFQERNPGFPEKFRSMYFQPTMPASPPTAHCGFLISDLEEAEEVASIKIPTVIYCGNKELLELLSKAFPDLSEIMILQRWYEANAFFVIENIPIPLRADRLKS